MDFVDAQLAHVPKHLSRRGGGLDRGVVWRHAAFVEIGEQVRQVCLGFTYPGERVMCVGISSKSERKVEVLGPVNELKAKLISRAKGPGDKPGLSLAFLLSYTKSLEEFLVYSHRKCTRETSCPYEVTYERLFPDGHDGMTPQAALSFCAATIACEQFFAAKIFGGAVNVDELFAAVSCGFRALDGIGDEIADGAFEFLCDLDELQRVQVGEWDERHFERQRHITVFVLSLLRTVEDAMQGNAVLV